MPARRHWLRSDHHPADATQQGHPARQAGEVATSLCPHTAGPGVEPHAACSCWATRVPAIIAVAGLGKTYRVPDKQPSLAGTVRDVLRRRTCNVQAMRHVSVQIQPVAMVGYLRASGAGTTTTLKMLCGLPHPSAGRLPVAGHLPQRRQETFRARSP